MAAVSTNGIVNSARREIPKGNRPGHSPPVRGTWALEEGSGSQI